MKKVLGTLQSQRMRNALHNLTGILLAMFAAGLLGRVVSEAATRQISDELTKLIVGIFIGALIGLGTGFLVQRAWGRLLEVVT